MTQASLFRAPDIVPRDTNGDYPFQAEALLKIREELASVDSTALIQATGTGKTRVFTKTAQHFVRKYQKPALVLAHRLELLDQTERVLQSFGLSTAFEQGNRRAIDRESFQVLLATVQSLKDRLADYPRDFFSLVITDECHHSVAAEYLKIYEHFAGTKHLGVTATPLRHDRIGLRNVYQSVAFQYPIQQGIEEGYLCELNAKRVTVEGLELEHINISNGDFSKKELDAMLMEEKVLLKMVLPTMEHAQDRPTIVFTQNIRHARAITACFNKQAGRTVAAYVDSLSDATERSRAIQQFKSGAIRFVINVNVLTEGFDHPPTACIALFRPTRSLGMLAQMVGRGTRLSPGKTDCLVLDFVGVNNTVRTLNVLDVLDGTILSNEEHALAQKYIDAGNVATMALKKAKEEIAKNESAAMEWKVIIKCQDYDMLKLFAIPSCRGLYGGSLCTNPQRTLLESWGVKVSPGLEKGQASKIIAYIIKNRIEKGLATFPQVKYLHYLGVKGVDLNTSFPDASRLISEAVSARRRRNGN